jgi:hypothetical protein
MNSIHLDDNSFWEWLNLGITAQKKEDRYFRPNSNGDYVRLLSLLMQNHWDSIALNKHVGGISKSIRTLDRLSRYIPRKYFLELQFCLASYSSIFATLFPSMLSHLDNLPYIEWLLYMEPDDERYRDHLVHMFRVAFVCDRLIQLLAIRQKAEEFQFSSSHFMEWCQERLDTDPSSWNDSRKNSVLYVATYLSAIFHDVGYGYHFLSKYRQRLAGLLPVLTQGEATADLHHRNMVNIRNSLAAKFVSKYHYAFQDKGYSDRQESFPANHDVILSGFFRDNLGLNHSVASGIFLVDLAGSLYDSHAISDDLYIAFHLAAEAAMLHDMTEDNKWLHFSKNKSRCFLDCEKQREIPIATLLCFADSMELGRRPRINKKVEDHRCTFSMDDESGNMTRIEYDESKHCLIADRQVLISEKDFIFDSEKNCFVLLDIPIIKSDSKS